jgi:hypothetical protein
MFSSPDGATHAQYAAVMSCEQCATHTHTSRRFAESECKGLAVNT